MKPFIAKLQFFLKQRFYFKKSIRKKALIQKCAEFRAHNPWGDILFLATNTREFLYRSVLLLPVLFIGDFLYNSFLLGISYNFNRLKWLLEGGICSAAVGENDRPGMGFWARGMIHPSLESWDPQLSIDPTSVVHSTYYVPSFIWKPLRARIYIVKIRACIYPYYSYRVIISLEGWCVFLARGARARALAARARMFVTSQVPFFPNLQHKTVCTLIYTLN